MKWILTIIACLTLLACGDKRGDPGVVAENYWAAIQQGDEATIKRLSVFKEPSGKTSGFTSETTVEGDKISEIRFGDPIIDKDDARVPTTIITGPERISEPATSVGPGEIIEISFDTYLVKVEDEWKVDKSDTDNNMMTAAFTAALGAMGEAFSEGMKEAAEGIGEAISEGMGAMVEGLAEGLSEGLELAKEGADEIANSVEQQPYIPPVVLPARVSGSIRGTAVELSSAEWSHNLGIYAGDGWGFNPSLLIFLFLPEGEVPAARTITIKSEDGGFNNPHIHYRWSDPASGDIESEVATSGYDMVLKFGEAVDKRVSGEIHFSVPGEDTRVAGSFEIELSE
ncbi:MAG: hypothetical protein KUG71_08475 [Porticoccaceae bacterium]|nr:hypothetical protein [Porticoccaceae bacterium]